MDAETAAPEPDQRTVQRKQPLPRLVVTGLDPLEQRERGRLARVHGVGIEMFLTAKLAYPSFCPHTFQLRCRESAPCPRARVRPTRASGPSTAASSPTRLRPRSPSTLKPAPPAKRACA